MIEKFGRPSIENFFNRENTIEEFRDALQKDLGFTKKKAQKIAESKDELIDEVVPFSVYFGPKLGSFIRT